MHRESKAGIITFFVIIIAIAITGFVLVKLKPFAKPNGSEIFTKLEDKKDIKIDDNKDYVYFTNEKVISEDLKLAYKDINININTDKAKEIEANLNKKTSEIRDSVVYLTEEEKKANTESRDNLKSADILMYDIKESSSYLSITASSYKYTMENGNTLADNSYYVFDLGNGNLLNNNDILRKEKITDADVRQRVRSYLDSDPKADIDTTLNEAYTLTISSTGKVVINILVQSENGNYIANIEMEK